jgi:hypothetical protein
VNTSQTTSVQAGDDPTDDDRATVASQAYIDELVATMTTAIDEQNPLSSKINNTTYTENLTTSARRQPARNWPRGPESGATWPVARYPPRPSETTESLPQP